MVEDRPVYFVQVGGSFVAMGGKQIEPRPNYNLEIEPVEKNKIMVRKVKKETAE